MCSNKIVLFSGGFDSTLVLYNILRESNGNDQVYVISVKSTVIGPYKTDREEKSRKIILDYLKSKFYMIKIHTIEISNDIKSDLSYNFVGLTQPLLWIPFSCLKLPMSNDYILYMSYIQGDQALMHREGIDTVIKLHQEMQKEAYRSFRIEYPLAYMEKDQVLLNLIHSDKFLYENATCCEDYVNEKDDCGRCIPCKHLRAALINILSSNINDKDRLYIETELKRRFNISVKITDEKFKEDTIDLKNNIVDNE